MEDEELIYTPKNTSPTNSDKIGNSGSQLIYTPKNKAIHDTTRFSADIHGYNLGIGDSIYDQGITWGTNIDENNIKDSINNFRSDKQGHFAEAGAGLGRFVNKVGTEIVKSVGAIGGLGVATIENIDDLFSGEDNHDFLDTTFNNAFIKGVDSFSEGINENLFPVYVNSAVRDGNFMDKVTNPEFWATEGADGLGFMVAFMAPGAGLKALNVGEKLGALSAKALATARYGGNVDKAIESMKAAGLTLETFDNVSITAANTLLESGAEAKGVGDDMDQRRQEFDEKFMATPEYNQTVLSELSKLDDLRRSGVITLQQYNEQSKLVPQQVLDARFKDQKGKAMRDTFLTNVLVLTGPNFIQAKMLYGKAGSKDFVNEMIAPSLKKKALNRTINFAESFASEGFEEVAQTTAEHRYTDRGISNQMGESYLSDANPGDFIDGFFETLGTTEGQVAGFLGGMLGGPMSAYHGAKADIADRAKTNRLIDLAKTNSSNYLDILNNSIYETYEVPNPETGEVDIKYRKNPDGSYKINPDNVIKVKSALNLMDEQSAAFDEAIQNGDENTVNQLRNIAETNLINQFITEDEMGIDALSQHLNTIFKVNEVDPNTGKTIINKENQNRIKDITDKAKYLQKTLQSFRDYSKGVIQLKNKDASKQDVLDFYNKLANIFVDQKSEQYEEKKNLNNLERLRSELLSELGANRTITEQDELLDEDKLNTEFKEGTTEEIYRNKRRKIDPRLKVLNDKIFESEDKLKEIDEVLNEVIWDSKNQNDLLNSMVQQRKKATEEFNKSEAYQQLIDKIKNAKSEEEIDDITASEPTLSSNPYVKQAAEAAKKIVNADLQEKDNNIKEDSKAVNDELQKQIKYIQENYKVGDEFTISEDYKLGPKFDGKPATIKKITDKNITFETVDGNKGTLNIGNFYKHNFNPQYQFGTEGGDTTNVEVEKTFDFDNVNFSTQGAKVISVDDNGDKISFVSDQLIDYERNPKIKKVGTSVNFEVNTAALNNENFIKAFEAFNNNDFTDIDLLINYLPLNVVFNESTKAPIFTYYKDKTGSSENFDTTTRVLRETIIKELAKGTPLNSITTIIEGQWNGQLQVEPTVVENNVADLYEFGGDIKNIKTDNIYIVNDFGALKNHKDKVFPTKRELAPGEVYVIIHTAAGVEFPLKLNVSRITPKQAEVLYELYKYRFDDISRGKSISMKEIDNDTLKVLIQENLADEIKVIGKSFGDITVKDLVDFLIWDGTDSVKSRVKFSNTRDGVKLLVTDKEYSKEEFANYKDDFITTLTSSKRQHIKFKPKEGEGIKSVNFSNRKYVDYLLTKGILNTNAKVNEPTFQGKTNIFLDTKNVKVNGKLSQFNPVVKEKVDNKKILGNNTQLKEGLPALFKLGLKLDSNGKSYTDNKGQKYNRVTSLKDIEANINEDSTVRGDVVDELIRLQLSSPVSLELDEFSKRGKDFLSKANSKKGTKVQISDKAYKDLYDILNIYKEEFSKRGFVVYSNTPSLGGKIGSKGMYAGTMDLLVRDVKNKQWVIIDVKTSSVDRAASYEDPTSDKFDYVGKDQLQQNAYAELFNQMTGQNISKIYIMPLQVPKESKESFDVDDINYNPDNLLLEVSMEKNVYDILGIKKEAVSKAKTSKITSTSNDEMSGVDFGDSSRANLSKLGVSLPQKKVVEKTTAPTKKFTFTQDQVKEMGQQFENGDFYTVDYAGEDILISHPIKKGDKIVSGYYFLNSARNTAVTDIASIEKILNKYNASFKQKFNVDNVLNVWKSRLNSVSLQKSTPVTKESFNSLQEEKDALEIEKEQIKAQGENMDFDRLNEINKRIRQLNPQLMSIKKPNSSPQNMDQFEPETNDFGATSGINLGKLGMSEGNTTTETTPTSSRNMDKAKKSDGINFTKVTTEQAEAGLKLLRNPSNAKFIMESLKRNKNNTIKTFEEVYKQAESKLTSEDEIKSLRTKCNL